MFGFGMSEILLILVVVLVLFGPSKLPEMARTIGKGLREMRRASDDLRTAIMMEDLDRPSPPVAAAPRRLDAPSPDAIQDAEVESDADLDCEQLENRVSRHEDFSKENETPGAQAVKSDVDLQKLIADAERTAREQERKQEEELAAAEKEAASQKAGEETGDQTQS